MKQSIKTRLKECTLLFLLGFCQVVVFAQDSTISSKQSSSTTTTTQTTAPSNDWYMQPWVWVVGGIVLILILVALFRGNSNTASSTDRVSVTKTVTRDSDNS